MNLNIFVLYNLTKDIQKTVIWGNLVFTWPPYWMAKIEKQKKHTQKKIKQNKNIFLIFVIFLPSNTNQIVKI